ncbi:hypothetical protein cypCar_00003240 [Cyprinus carpio]|nr:hypothetical protein cypCar_00003240 [Cyprinus carpio]
MEEEDPVMQPGHDDNDVGLAQILTEVVEEVRLSIDREVNGADLLYSLLSAPWLYSLLRVYESLVQHSRDAPSPYLSYSSRLSQEIMASVRGLAAPSSEAQELYILLKCPHMQALLSAHDSVAQRDYGPVLPPLPDKLPDNEEAMRIVCLVKNKQPLCVKEGKPSYWNSLRRLTVEKLALARRFGSGEQSLLGSADGLSSSTGLLSSEQSHSLPSNTMQPLQVFIMPDQKQGATIRKNEKTGNFFIARVIHGGLADRSGEEEITDENKCIETDEEDFEFGRFLEYGEHNGHMYGTSLDSFQDVLDNGKICVIDLEPHCIHSVRTKKLKPYIIFVRPPSPARMKQTRKDPHFLSNRYIKRYFYDKDFEEIEEASRTMEAKYRQYFDCVIVNDDLQDSCMDLFTAIQHAQEEPQWIPASWFAPDHP